jgi:hypothetical protein
MIIFTQLLQPNARAYCSVLLTSTYSSQPVLVTLAVHLLLGWVHTCNVTAYRNTALWQCGRGSWPRNVSEVCYAVTLRACSVCCWYLAVASKGWYGYGRSRCGSATWHVTTTALFFKRNIYIYIYICTQPLLAAKTSLGLP